ncbi:MAG: hypothetical protein IJS45_02255 [Clostridia bacterium]|nr:hypothetical protein [Clostridia bacterium]
MSFKRALALIFVSLIVLIPALGNVSFAAESNEQIIYRFLKNDLGLNDAQACGVLANIYGESRFDPQAYCIDVDGYPSYGLCQWHVSRYETLKSYCEMNDLDYTTVKGQMQFLKYELLGYEQYAYSMILGLPNTEEGAYQAGYNWSRYFGRGASSLYELRGNLAKTMFWPKYGSQGGSPYAEVSEGTYYIINNANGLYLTVPSHGQANGDDVSVSSLSDSRYFKFTLRKGSYGYVIKPTYTDNSVVNIYTAALVESGKNVTLWKASGNSSQEWVFKATANGYIICSAQKPECVLDISDGTVKVITYSSSSSSQVWNLFSLETPAIPPDAVTPTVKTGAAGSNTEFSWSEAAYANEYEINIYDTSTGTLCANESLTGTSFKIALQAGTYSATVNSINNLGNSQKLVTEGPEVCFTVVGGHSHSFTGIIETLSEATCSQMGFMKVFCTDEECGQYMTVETPKLPHTYSTVFIPATYSSSGAIQKVCDVCGDTVVEQTLPMASATSTAIVVSDADIQAGQSSVIPVTLKNAKGISFGMFSVAFDDSKVSLKSITTSNGKVANFMSNGSTVYFEVPKSDATDIVFNFTFSVKSNVYGNLTVTPTYALNAFSTSSDELVFPAVDSGKISIKRNDVSFGDANCDGAITISDLLIIRKYIAAIIGEESIHLDSADTNHDGYITVSDVLIIRKYIAGMIDEIQ